jgi:hypothetical protein
MCDVVGCDRRGGITISFDWPKNQPREVGEWCISAVSVCRAHAALICYAPRLCDIPMKRPDAGKLRTDQRVKSITESWPV